MRDKLIQDINTYYEGELVTILDNGQEYIFKMEKTELLDLINSLNEELEGTIHNETIKIKEYKEMN